MLALIFMGIHLGFYLSLNRVPLSQAFIGEPLQAALGNILAIFIEISLLSGVAVAYDQTLWRLFRHKAIKSAIIDKLATLAASPWNLFRINLFITAPTQWILGASCFLIAIAAVFPPGALTVEFRDHILPVLDRVPTLNISDWGNGSLTSFSSHALFLVTGDFAQK